MVYVVLYVAVLGFVASYVGALAFAPDNTLFLPPVIAGALVITWCLVVLYARSRRRPPQQLTR